MLVAHDYPTRAAILRHRNNKWVSVIDALQRSCRVVMRGHELPDNALDGDRLLHEERGLRLCPKMAIITGSDFITDNAGRSESPRFYQRPDAAG